MSVIPNSGAKSGRESDLTMRWD